MPPAGMTPYVHMKTILKSFLILAVLVILGIACLFTFGPKIHYLSPEMRCGTNLYKIGKALMAYKADHEGVLPTSLLILMDDTNKANLVQALPKRAIVGDQAVCIESQLPYVYHPELVTDESKPICWDPKPHSIKRNFFQSKPGRNVLYADGHVSLMKEDIFQKVLKGFASQGLVTFDSNNVSSTK